MFPARQQKAPRRSVRMTALLAFSLLAACGSVLESGKPARQVYLLQAPAVSASKDSATPRATLVVSVNAVPGLDTDTIQVLSSNAQMIPVSNAHWVDNMPEVFSSITRRFLSNSGNFNSVRKGTMARPGQWLLELELQAFYGIQNSAGSTDAVELRMEGLLHCNKQQHVIHVTDRSSANGDSLSSLVAAHQDVLDDGMKILLSDIAKACAGSATS